MNLILCGLPRSGKTTVGKKLAESLGWPFLDLDLLIEEAYGQPCRQLFKEKGEENFRKWENGQVEHLRGVTHHVIALGGGTLLNPENVQLLQKIGMLVYLKVSSPIIWERIQKPPLPAYLETNNPQKTFQRMVEKRLPHYEATSSLIVNADTLSVEDIVQTIQRNTFYVLRRD